MLRLDVRQDVELNQDEGSGSSLPLTDRRGLVTLIGKSLDEPRAHGHGQDADCEDWFW